MSPDVRSLLHRRDSRGQQLLFVVLSGRGSGRGGGCGRAAAVAVCWPCQVAVVGRERMYRTSGLAGVGGGCAGGAS